MIEKDHNCAKFIMAFTMKLYVFEETTLYGEYSKDRVLYYEMLG